MKSFTPMSLYDQRGNRKYLNTSERRLFYNAVVQHQDEQRSLFFLLLFLTGMRISEALNITALSFDFEDKLVVVKCLKKRDKVIYRRIPLPPDYLKSIKSFIEYSNTEQYLWHWSRRTAARYIKKLMLSCNITGTKACAKGLRHSFAVHCVTCNIPITLLQKWMGHSHISTTSIYLDIVGAEFGNNLKFVSG